MQPRSIRYRARLVSCGSRAWTDGRRLRMRPTGTTSRPGSASRGVHSGVTGPSFVAAAASFMRIHSIMVRRARRRSASKNQPRSPRQTTASPRRSIEVWRPGAERRHREQGPGVWRGPRRAACDDGGDVFRTGSKSGYAQQFNLGVQQELPARMVLEVAYIGNISRKLPGPNLSINQIPPDALRPGAPSRIDRFRSFRMSQSCCRRSDAPITTPAPCGWKSASRMVSICSQPTLGRHS